ncbi:MAG: phosphomannomutase, partial [Bradymonadia bacterium]
LSKFSNGAVVVGFDARYGSKTFAEDTACVLQGLGLTVYLDDRPRPTPCLAFAVKHLGCIGGVMVTASHNPPADNGYKVYWADAAQIIPPHDIAIAAQIDAIPDLQNVRLGELSAIRALPAEVQTAYAAEVDALRCYDGPTDLKIVYTAMHGVGRDTIVETLTRNGYTDLHPVAAQAEPDPDFPTVSFPNPEEPGALDLALADAKRLGADVILANDPDADRLAVAIPSAGDASQGRYRALSGNELGALIAADRLKYADHGDNPLVATTVVSSQLLARQAAAANVAFVETLTGFKWIASAAMAHDGRFLFGFEEAIGYSVGEVVRDKDGVSAALIVCDLLARAKAAGRTGLDLLADVYREHGVHRSAQHSVRLPGVEGAAQIVEIMRGLRADPPTQIAGQSVAKVFDFMTENKGVDGGLPPTNLLRFTLADGARILARPSGTEPKLKFYFEVVGPLGDSLAAGEAAADAGLEAVMSDFLGQVSARFGI